MNARMDLDFWESVRVVVRSGGTATWQRNGAFFSVDGSQDPPVLTVETGEGGPLELPVYRMMSVVSTEPDGADTTWLIVTTNACQLRWKADEPEREPNVSSIAIGRMIRQEEDRRVQAEAEECEDAEEGYE